MIHGIAQKFFKEIWGPVTLEWTASLLLDIHQSHVPAKWEDRRFLLHAILEVAIT